MTDYVVYNSRDDTFLFINRRDYGSEIYYKWDDMSYYGTKEECDEQYDLLTCSDLAMLNDDIIDESYKFDENAQEIRVYSIIIIIRDVYQEDDYQQILFDKMASVLGYISFVPFDSNSNELDFVNAVALEARRVYYP